jgi:hypothetical protein
MPWYIWPDVGCEGQCGARKQARGEGSKSARKEQRGVRYGLGEAIHCRPPPQRWPNCWAWSVDIFIMYLAKTCPVSSFTCCTLVEDGVVVGFTYLLLYTLDPSGICLTKFLFDWLEITSWATIVIVPVKTLHPNIKASGTTAKLYPQKGRAL